MIPNSLYNFRFVILLHVRYFPCPYWFSYAYGWSVFLSLGNIHVSFAFDTRCVCLKSFGFSECGRYIGLRPRWAGWGG